MKTILSIFVAILASTQLLHAQAIQTTTFPNIGTAATRQQDIPVPAGQVFELLTWSAAGNGPNTIRVDGIDVGISISSGDTSTPPILSPSFVVAGPRTVSLVVLSNTTLVCSYRLNNSAEVTATNIPSMSVVIPADATGPVQIMLESSTDLITWTAANPGTYGSSTSKRFFRVRAVAQ